MNKSDRARIGITHFAKFCRNSGLPRGLMPAAVFQLLLAVGAMGPPRAKELVIGQL